VVPYLVETGELTVLDLMPLAIYCAAARDWLQSNEVIQKVGTVMKSPSGFPVQSPYVSIANRSAEVMLKILLEFKFTTASRGRRSTDEPSSSSGLLELKPLDVSKW
jgi:P27 family predicted phage terminase small subunit